MKRSLAWPRSSGHDVHAYHMMRGLVELGQLVGLCTEVPPTEKALDDLSLSFYENLGGSPSPLREKGPRLSPLQERFRSYWGIEREQILGVAACAERFSADAVVSVGLEAPPYLAGTRGAIRIWYAADEWVRHHLSQARLFDHRSWVNIPAAILKGAYERAYAPLLDRVWVVSEGERKAMRWLAGVRAVDIVPNGVDTNFFHPREAAIIPRSAVFWGRLDFGPNIQGLEWFCSKVWPSLRREAPDALFTIIGFAPSQTVRELARAPGVRLLADLPDLRDEVTRHALVVLPFVSGGGIKNKLLEAAAVGKPILCTPRALEGLQPPLQAELISLRSGRDWVREMIRLWADSELSAELGRRVRSAVVRTHAWSTSAERAIGAIEQHLQDHGSRKEQRQK